MTARIIALLVVQTILLCIETLIVRTHTAGSHERTISVIIGASAGFVAGMLFSTLIGGLAA